MHFKKLILGPMAFGVKCVCRSPNMQVNDEREKGLKRKRPSASQRSPGERGVSRFLWDLVLRKKMKKRNPKPGNFVSEMTTGI